MIHELIAQASNVPDPSFAVHFLEWISRFHVVIAHFPIAFLLGAAMAESWNVWRRNRTPSVIVRFCLWIGAAGAVVTASLGWPHAILGGFGDLPGNSLPWHRWLGTAAAILAIVTLIISERDAYKGRIGIPTRAMLFTLAALIVVTGHLGGLLTHGEDFLKW